jgi:hypothetical protein
MILDPILDLFRGKAVTVPPLDGAFRPNTRLDAADCAAQLSEPVDLAVRQDTLLVASGNAVHAVGKDGGTSVFAHFTAPVSAIAVSGDGQVAVGLDTGALHLDGVAVALPADIRSITALTFAPDGALLIANGSARHRPSEWRIDLMEKGASGSVWIVAKDGNARRIADNLAWPQGLLARGGDVVVSESWRRRLIRISTQTGEISVVVSNIPGYPGRMSRDGEGALLSVFAPVNRLIEFVLQEDDYRQAMMAEIAPEFWIAPTLASGRSFLEPLQCGGIKTMGIHKPWAPSRSYGLLVRLDSGLQPFDSYHSRADGKRHGIVAAVAVGETIYAASAGGDEILALPRNPEFG